MIPPGYKGSSHGAQGSVSVRHTHSQRPYVARALSVRAPHARAASAHRDAPGCDAHHKNMLCVALVKTSAIKKASVEIFICSQFFVQAGFILKRLFDSGRDKERSFRTSAQPSTNWDRIAILKFFLPTQTLTLFFFLVLAHGFGSGPSGTRGDSCCVP